MVTWDCTLWAHTNEFISCRTFLLEHGIVHGDKLTFVDFNLIAVFVASLRFCKADGTDFRVSKDNAGDICVVKFCGGHSSEKTVSKTTSCCNRNYNKLQKLGEIGPGVSSTCPVTSPIAYIPLTLEF